MRFYKVQGGMQAESVASGSTTTAITTGPQEGITFAKHYDEYTNIGWITMHNGDYVVAMSRLHNAYTLEKAWMMVSSQGFIPEVVNV